jgi:hypothetical protein
MPSRIKIDQRNNKDIKKQKKKKCAGWVSTLLLFVMRFVVFNYYFNRFAIMGLKLQKFVTSLGLKIGL